VLAKSLDELRLGDHLATRESIDYDVGQARTKT
jgi:hypothetical protein